MFPNIVRFNVMVQHTAISTDPAYEVVLTEHDSAFAVYFYDEWDGPSLTDPGFIVVGDKIMTWTISPLGKCSS